MTAPNSALFGHYEFVPLGTTTKLAALEKVAVAARILVDACDGNEDVRGVGREEDAVRTALNALDATGPLAAHEGIHRDGQGKA